jgi:hypothetical protein
MHTGAKVRFRGQFSAATKQGLTPDDVGTVAQARDAAGGSWIVDVTFPNGVVVENVLSDLIEEVEDGSAAS